MKTIPGEASGSIWSTHSRRQSDQKRRKGSKSQLGRLSFSKQRAYGDRASCGMHVSTFGFKHWKPATKDTNCHEIPMRVATQPQDISTMTVVQGLSKAAEKGAAKAEMKSKEVLHFWIRMEWIWIMDAAYGMKRCEMFPTFSGEG